MENKYSSLITKTTLIFDAIDCFTQTNNMNCVKVIQLVLLPNFQYKSNRLEVFCKKGVLKNLPKFYRKTPVPEPLFNKVTGLRCANLFKKRVWHRCFPVNFAKFLRTPFFMEYLWWLLLLIVIVDRWAEGSRSIFYPSSSSKFFFSLILDFSLLTLCLHSC